MPTTVGIYLVRLRDVIAWIMTEQCYPYGQNRAGNGIGEAKINPVKVAFIANEFDKEHFSEVQVGWNKKTKRNEIADGHNRWQGGLDRYFAGKMTSKELDSLVAFRYVSDHNKAYINAGRASSHTSGERTACVDLCYGDAIENSLKPKLTMMAVEFIQGKSKILSIIREFMFALEKLDRKTEWVASNVYTRGGNKESKDLEYREAGYFKFSEKNLQQLADAINSYVGFIQEYHRTAPAFANQLDRIANGSAFFFFFCYEALSPNPRIKIKPATIIKRCTKDIVKFSNLCNALFSGPQVNQDTRLEAIYKDKPICSFQKTPSSTGI